MDLKKVKSNSTSQQKENLGVCQEASPSNKMNDKSVGKKKKKRSLPLTSPANGSQLDNEPTPKIKKPKLTEAISLSGEPKTSHQMTDLNNGESVKKGGKTPKKVDQKKTSDQTNDQGAEESNKTLKNVDKKKNLAKQSVTSTKELETSRTEENRENDSDEEADGPQSKRHKKKKTGSYKEKMSEDESERTIFVGNLPVGITKQDVKKFFSVCGSVETARIRSLVPKKDKIPKKVAAIKSEISTEYKDSVDAYVKFFDAKSVENALKMNCTLMGTRRLQIDSCKANVTYDFKRSAFVGNLPFTCKEDALYNHFANCGEIERVRIVRNSLTGSGQGFGFIVFKDESAAVLAMKLNGEKFENRPLRVSRVIKKFGKKNISNKKVHRTGNTVVDDHTSKSGKSKKVRKNKAKKGIKKPSEKVTSFMT